MMNNCLSKYSPSHMQTPWWESPYPLLVPKEHFMLHILAILLLYIFAAIYIMI